MTFSLKSNSFACFYQIGSRMSWSRNYASKDIRIGVEARAGMLKGVKELLDGIKVTMDLVPGLISKNRSVWSWS
jgi:hypothetical protein